MTPPLDDDDLHSLLARGGLSGAQRDRIFDNVAGAQSSSRRSRFAWGIAAGVLLPVAALVALGISRRDPDAPGEWLVPKGAGTGATIEARCPDRKPGECHVGDRLLFELGGAVEGGFFAGYADCEGKERIWYAPSTDGKLPEVPATHDHALVPQAARIGTEHGDGTCSLQLFLLRERVDRAKLSSGAVEARARATVKITMRR